MKETQTPNKQDVNPESTKTVEQQNDGSVDQGRTSRESSSSSSSAAATPATLTSRDGQDGMDKIMVRKAKQPADEKEISYLTKR